MGRVLADVAAYEEEPRRLIFTCLFFSLFFVCAFLVELCTTYPVVLTVVQRRNIAMGDDSYDAFLNILEGDRNKSVTVDSPPAVKCGEVLNPAGGFVSHGLSSLNSDGGKCAGTG